MENASPDNQQHLQESVPVNAMLVAKQVPTLSSACEQHSANTVPTLSSANTQQCQHSAVPVSSTVPTLSSANTQQCL